MAAVILFAAGCKSEPAEAGYSKDDFSKRPPPAGYGPPGGNHATPPTGK